MSNLELPSSDATNPPDEHPTPGPRTSAASQSFNVSHVPDASHAMLPAPSVESRAPQRNVLDARSSISKILKNKETEWTAVATKDRPLRLLDLPVDILKDIVKEVGDRLKRKCWEY